MSSLFSFGPIYDCLLDAKKDDENDKKEPEEWGEFLHQPGVKYTDFNLIREEIVRDTEAKTGKNAGMRYSSSHPEISPTSLTPAPFYFNHPT